MSDETPLLPDSPDDECEESAPTERAPSLLGANAPPRGVALSVLWWREGDVAATG